jgi:predicted negative regulator of RcsB-dependent stress response
LTRHELKEQIRHDQFTDAVSQALEYTVSHRKQVTRWAFIVIAVILAVVAGLWYSSARAADRKADLDSALAVASAPVGQAAPGSLNFPTQEAKNNAALKALSGVVAKDGGTREAYIAQYCRGTLRAQTGDTTGAQADLETVAKSGGEMAPLAKIALAQLYAAQNKTAQAQAYLRDLINKPTDLVSKEQAQILLAQLLAKTNPAEAKKIVQSVKSAPGVSPAVAHAADEVVPQSSK